MVESTHFKHLSRIGRDLRRNVPRSSHGEWAPAKDRPDPIGLIEGQNRRRLPSLVPVRWGRMLESPFSFLRGAALVMASDLARTPTTGLVVQACGDAHVGNFGVFASPERDLLFDVNDFDETHPGPWEWDLKRLATSAVVAARSAGHGDKAGLEAARAATRTYRLQMKHYSRMGILDVWYSKVDAHGAESLIGRGSDPKDKVRSAFTQAQHHTSAAALPALTALSKRGHRRIVDHPPLVTHDIVPDHSEVLGPIMSTYRHSLEDDRRSLLDRFEVVDFALKVVGVGSVGTRCFIALLLSDLGDPVLLQVKEAEASVLEGLVPESKTLVHAAKGAPQGSRVVTGQRLMQAASDIFLGWSSAEGFDYYVRQLRDMKGTVDLYSLSASDLVTYLELCGWTLARAHARSGHAATIAGYAGSGEVLDESISTFAGRYADQTEADHALLVSAVKSGRVVADTGV